MSEPKYPSQLAERFQIRMPDGLRDRIAEAAKANSRSMNSEIVARLEDSFGDKTLTLIGDPEGFFVSAVKQREMTEQLIAKAEALLDQINKATPSD